MKHVSILWRGLMLALLTFGSYAARAQGVGIGTTAPNASAALDVVSSAKGALLPRLTSAQRAAIASPATGLIVFQTDGTSGFYYNSGTPAAPAWQQIATAVGTSTGFIQNQTTADQAASFRISGTGTAGTSLGVGTSAPQLGLDATGAASSIGLRNNAAWDHLYWFHDGSTALMRAGGAEAGLALQVGASATGTYGDASQAYRDVMRLLPNGNVGIGTTAPTTLLDVNGSTRLRGLTAGVVSAAADGTLSSSSATTAFGTSFIQNGTALQAGSNFNISGNGTASTLRVNSGLQFADRTSAANYFEWYDQAGVAGLYSSVGGANRLSVTTGGNVGIGTDAPAQRLDVTGGSIRISTAGQGLIFPDGTIQTTAATGGTGSGTTAAGPGLSSTTSGTATTIKLGGTALAAATDVPLAGNSLTFSGTGSVGIGTTAPDASAALDVVSSNKGALLPRVTDVTVIASPATGLIVFQTGGTAGYYYNAGTAGSPNWLQLVNSAQLTNVNTVIAIQNADISSLRNRADVASAQISNLNANAVTSASNGLIKTGNNVALGGTLTAATDVPLAGNALTFSGSGSVGIGTTAPNASAQLDLTSTTKGFLPPRLTSAQRDAIASPAAGLVVYNTSTNKLNLWNGTQWVAYAVESAAAALSTTTFGFTGGAQTYVVPAGVTTLRFDLTGASGGGRFFISSPPGLGGRLEAMLPVTPGQTLTIRVGGTTTSITGGYNGGGDGNFGSGGGGASDVQTSAGVRVLVAGGGGGTNNSQGYSGTFGGDGGTLKGGAGGAGGGAGGTQSVYTSGSSTSSGGSSRGSGGGGGYYGGGAGSDGVNTVGGGGGGSSYAASNAYNVIHTQGYRTGDGYVTITPVQ